jgi:hypothetical protein
LKRLLCRATPAIPTSGNWIEATCEHRGQAVGGQWLPAGQLDGVQFSTGSVMFGPQHVMLSNPHVEFMNSEKETFCSAIAS